MSPQESIAHYRVVSKLGEGGMGAVYRATDTKLNRDVAIKVLPAALTKDPERLARFEREAKVLASLNHPNIAQIYGLEQAGDSPALVMEAPISRAAVPRRCSRCRTCITQGPARSVIGRHPTAAVSWSSSATRLRKRRRSWCSTGLPGCSSSVEILEKNSTVAHYPYRA